MCILFDTINNFKIQSRSSDTILLFERRFIHWRIVSEFRLRLSSMIPNNPPPPSKKQMDRSINARPLEYSSDFSVSGTASDESKQFHSHPKPRIVCWDEEERRHSPHQFRLSSNNQNPWTKNSNTPYLSNIWYMDSCIFQEYGVFFVYKANELFVIYLIPCVFTVYLHICAERLTKLTASFTQPRLNIIIFLRDFQYVVDELLFLSSFSLLNYCEGQSFGQCAADDH